MKIEKVDEEIAKTKQKITNYQTRLRELERKKKEIENTEIVSLVRGMNVPPDKLHAFIKSFHQQNPDAINASIRKEETLNEE